MDTIVVGAGAAGCVVARHLTDAGQRVALFEAGPGRPLPAALATIDALDALAVEPRFWPDVRAVGAGGEPGRRYPIGRGLGGGSAVNSMVLMSGNRSDYDNWEVRFGLTGWRWSALADSFDLVRGMLGPTTAELGPLARAVRDAAVEHGHAIGPPSAEVDGFGFGPASLAAAGTTRLSAADALLAPGDEGVVAGLAVRVDRFVERVRFEGSRVVGIELTDGSMARAERVVLCAGALGSPALLARSGLAAEPFPLADHPSFVFSLRLRPSHRSAADRPVAPISAVLRWRSDDVAASAGTCDAAAMVMDHVGRGVQREVGAVIVSLLGAPSLGRFRTHGLGFDVEPGWLDDRDERRMVRAVRHIADLLRSGPIVAAAEAVYLDEAGTSLEVMASWSDDDLLDWIRSHPGPVHHPASSLPMGSPDRGGAIDTAGAIAGRLGLHVADASVLPRLPTANPQLPVMAVATRLAARMAER